MSGETPKPYPPELPDPWWARLAGIMTCLVILVVMVGAPVGGYLLVREAMEMRRDTKEAKRAAYWAERRTESLLTRVHKLEAVVHDTDTQGQNDTLRWIRIGHYDSVTTTIRFNFCNEGRQP